MDCIINFRTPNNEVVKKCIRDILRDDQKYYRLVFQHCKTCRQCNPNEILRVFLNNRNTKEKKGNTTGSLVELAQKFQRNVPGTSPEIVKEFLLKTNSIAILLKNLQSLTKTETLKIVKNIYYSYANIGSSRTLLSDFRMIYFNEHRIQKNTENYIFLTSALTLIVETKTMPEINDETIKLIEINSVLNS